MKEKTKILIIAGCSKKKLKYPAAAKDLYQGVLFKKIKKLVESNNFDFMIISAKYGLLKGIDLINPYNKKIHYKKDIIELREIVIPKLISIEENYNQIIIIMGKKYREVIKPLFKEKYKMVYDSRGIGGLTQKFNKYLQNPISRMLDELVSCKIC